MFSYCLQRFTTFHNVSLRFRKCLLVRSTCQLLVSPRGSNYWYHLLVPPIGTTYWYHLLVSPTTYLPPPTYLPICLPTHYHLHSYLSTYPIHLSVSLPTCLPYLYPPAWLPAYLLRTTTTANYHLLVFFVTQDMFS